MIKGALYMADEMLTAGAKALGDTPEKEEPMQTVARVYTAMEVVRLMIEHVMEHEAADNKVLH